MLDFHRAIFRYRSLLHNLVRRDQKLQYRNTVLGFLWSFLNPLLLMLVFVVVFGEIGRFSETIEHYPLFLLTALLPWRFFAGALAQSVNVLRDAAPLLLKVPFPRQIVPLAGVSGHFVTFAFSLLILLAIMALWPLPFTGYYAYLLPVIACQFLMLVGMAYLLAVLGVYFQDTSYLLNIGLNIGFYLTPIFYSIDSVPPELLTAFRLNPMVNFITAYRRIMLYGKPPGEATLLTLIGTALLIYAAGVLIFRRHQSRLAERL